MDFFFQCLKKTLIHSRCLKNIRCREVNDTTIVREITNTDSIIMEQHNRS